MTRVIFLLLFYGFAVSGNSQALIKLRLLDRAGDPVPYAAVLYKTDISRSDPFGITILKNYSFGEKITIRRTGFYDTTLILQKPKTTPDTTDFTVYLHSKVTLLGEIPVILIITKKLTQKEVILF
jgi:hypothetical protein